MEAVREGGQATGLPWRKPACHAKARPPTRAALRSAAPLVHHDDRTPPSFGRVSVRRPLVHQHNLAPCILLAPPPRCQRLPWMCAHLGILSTPFRHPRAHPPVARLPVCARQPWYLPQPLRNQPVAGLKRSCPLPHPQVCLGSLLQLVAITPPRHPTALKGSGQVGIATIEVADEVPTRRGATAPARRRS
jgi:hypothetical protein